MYVLHGPKIFRIRLCVLDTKNLASKYGVSKSQISSWHSPSFRQRSPSHGEVSDNNFATVLRIRFKLVYLVTTLKALIFLTKSGAICK